MLILTIACQYEKLDHAIWDLQATDRFEGVRPFILWNNSELCAWAYQLLSASKESCTYPIR